MIDKFLVSAFGGSFWRSVLSLFVLDWISIILLLPFIVLIAVSSPHVDLPKLPWWVVVFLGPFIETLALMLLARIGLFLSANWLLVAIGVGIAAGAAHSLDGLGHVLSPSVGFTLYAYAYLSWRDRGFIHSFFVPFLPHVAHNGVLVFLLYLMGLSS